MVWTRIATISYTNCIHSTSTLNTLVQLLHYILKCNYFGMTTVSFLSILLAPLMRNYFPKRTSGAHLHTLSKLYDVPVAVVTTHPLFRGSSLLYLRSSQGSCCSISGVLSCFHIHVWIEPQQLYYIAFALRCARIINSQSWIFLPLYIFNEHKCLCFILLMWTSLLLQKS